MFFRSFPVSPNVRARIISPSVFQTEDLNPLVDSEINILDLRKHFIKNKIENSKYTVLYSVWINIMKHFNGERDSRREGG